MPQVVANRHVARIAGTACLDFINNEIHTYDDALRWAVSEGVVTTAERRRLKPSRTEFAALLRLRRILYDAVVRRRLAPFNAELRKALGAVKISERGRWSIDPGPKAIRYRLLWQAAVLLTSGRLLQLKRCANPECGRLFLDESRRRNRRWCSMAGCGNRAKARRYYRRTRALNRGRSTGKRPPRRRPRRRDRP